MSGEDCVIEAKAARRQGRLTDATALYEQAAEAYRTGGENARWAHSLRHAAEFAVKAGDGQTGLREARAVVEYYRIDPPPTLEMANALRVAALAEAAAGDVSNSRQYWSEARALYADAGVPQGVMDAERHVAALQSA